jgi:bacterioferritin (cytochrome b1)
MERILFIDGTPSMEPMSLTIGKSVKEMIESDLDLEHGACCFVQRVDSDLRGEQ